jgi:hypothetical protein
MSIEAMKQALEALEFALHIGFPESSESQIKKGEKAYQQHRAAITAIKEALAQPEQEPVATLDALEQEIYENTRQFVSHDVMEWMLKRYYTTPPQRTWVGLTDEEIQAEWLLTPQHDKAEGLWFGRRLEAKLKEKNI